jgi:hypothetical protein
MAVCWDLMSCIVVEQYVTSQKTIFVVTAVITSDLAKR